LIRKGRGTEELVDRLLISSLIEARSCERFKLLGETCEDDLELRKSISSALWASEHGHYLSSLQLAEQLLPSEEVDRSGVRCWSSEARIIQTNRGTSDATAVIPHNAV